MVDLSRQRDMVGDLGGYYLVVFGGGSIGSYAVDIAVSMGITAVCVVDFDEVSPENVAPSDLGKNNVGNSKVRAIQYNMHQRYGVHISPVVDDLTLIEEGIMTRANSQTIGLVCTDSMRTRQLAWEMWRHKCRWWVDAAIGGRQTMVYTVDMQDAAMETSYSQSLEMDADGELPCGMKATSFISGGFTAGMIGQVFHDISNEIAPPYLQTYNALTRMYVAAEHSV